MRAQRLRSLLLLAAYLSACTSYKVTTTPLPELVAPPKPAKELMVQTQDGRSLLLHDLRVRNDSLFGTVGGRTTDEQAVAVPFAEIRSVKVPSGPSSGAYIAGGAAVFGAIVLLVSCPDLLMASEC